MAAVSQYLRLLRDTGLVEARADGRRRFYRLRPEGFADLRGWSVRDRAGRAQYW